MSLRVDPAQAELRRMHAAGGRFSAYAHQVVLDLALELPRGARAEVRSPEDRVVALTGYPGWEAFEITMQVDNSAGEPALTALSMSPRHESGRKEMTPIDGQRLASFPALRLARIATQALLLGSVGQANYRASPGIIPRRPRRGSESFSRFVADVVRTAQASGVPIQKAVGAAFGVTDRPTAERYIREARERGLLPESDRSAAIRN